ncbi:hypothetical protein [Streptomyces sp. TS71-3]|uniref:hypothetical protein n=1 Tax=Streptomyces sp. TS71-3 TaxID=2733862 RepID=UPI001B1B9F0C|nr:hypothetical protein [Streptomyces sp. TS71-3]GHJ34717.1 hypothetical protein Sm713_03260 [Streptomyces sp. TS71-3]
MGSLRNPIGPLPSSIYWRRRALLLALFAVVVLLAVWFATSGGGGGGKGSGGSEGKNPAPSITPGPSGSGPAISEHPGGRDESDGGGASSGGAGDTAGTGGSGSGSTSGSGSGSGGSAGGAAAGGAAAGGGSQTGGGAGGEVPAGSSLPTCSHSAVRLTLRSVDNSYAPGHSPRFQLTAANTSGGDCKIDLGSKGTVLTITQSSSDKQIWASDDCPKDGGSFFLRVPAGAGATHTVTWNRTPSAPHCATPSTASAAPGTYLVEASAPGYPKVRTSFVLSQD